MIQEIQSWIWNIGGLLFTISIFLLILAYIWSFIIDRLCGWHKKDYGENLFYWVRKKKRLNEIIEEERRGKEKMTCWFSKEDIEAIKEGRSNDCVEQRYHEFCKNHLRGKKENENY